MAGRKPAFSLAANKKDGGKKENGKKIYLDIGAAWPNSYGGYNFSLAKGAKIKLADGTIINGEDFWFTLFDKRENKDEGGGDDDWGDGPPAVKGKGWDGKEDPFAGLQSPAGKPQSQEDMDRELNDIFGGPKLVGTGKTIAELDAAAAAEALGLPNESVPEGNDPTS